MTHDAVWHQTTTTLSRASTLFRFRLTTKCPLYYLHHMVYEFENYRTFLKKALTERSQNVPGHSLRSFATNVGVSNSFLSEVLSSKKSLSVELAFKIGVKLKLTDSEIQYLCLLVQFEHEDDPEFRQELLKRMTAINPQRRTHDLRVDVFTVISEWYHLAIIELTRLPTFKLEAIYISQRLGITKSEAEVAIERLQRLELIEKDGKGKWTKCHNYVLAESKVPNSAFRKFHTQYLEKAIKALEKFATDERVSSTDIVAIDSKHLIEADKLAREFSLAILRLSEKSKLKMKFTDSQSIFFH